MSKLAKEQSYQHETHHRHHHHHHHHHDNSWGGDFASGKSPPQLLSDCSTNNPVSVERVQHFKLLGITLSHDISWQAHFDAIITKASSRLYFLKILKKSGLQTHQLRHFYLSVIRPILEYCSPIWHHGLIKAQAESLEAIQRRALRIIDSSTVGMPYEVALSLTQWASSSLSTIAENT